MAGKANCGRHCRAEQSAAAVAQSPLCTCYATTQHVWELKWLAIIEPLTQCVRSTVEFLPIDNQMPLWGSSAQLQQGTWFTTGWLCGRDKPMSGLWRHEYRLGSPLISSDNWDTATRSRKLRAHTAARHTLSQSRRLDVHWYTLSSVFFHDLHQIFSRQWPRGLSTGSVLFTCISCREWSKSRNRDPRQKNLTHEHAKSPTSIDMAFHQVGNAKFMTEYNENVYLSLQYFKCKLHNGSERRYDFTHYFSEASNASRLPLTMRGR